MVSPVVSSADIERAVSILQAAGLSDVAELIRQLSDGCR